jgi:hypothetical protein
MNRAVVLVVAASLTGCSYFGATEGERAASAPDAGQIETASAPDTTTPPAPVEAGVKSITPPQALSTVAVADAWALVSPKGSKVAAGYFIVANGGIESDRLIAAKSPRAARTEIHEIALDGNVAKMRPLDNGIEVPSGGSTTLQEDGLHVMFLDVDAPFTEGETIPVTLIFEKAGHVDVTMKVKRGGRSVAQH